MKDFLTILSTYKGYIGLLFGFASLVFAYGVKSATKEISSKSTDARIEKWIEYDSISHNENVDFQEKLLIKLDGLSDSIGFIYRKQSGIVKSVDALASKVAESVPEYIRLINGLQFELVQPEPVRSVFPETKIRAIPIPKDSVK